MDLEEAKRLLQPHAGGTVSVPVLYDAEREAVAYVLAELERLQAMEQRARAEARKDESRLDEFGVGGVFVAGRILRG